MPRVIDPLPVTLDKPRTLLFDYKAIKACELELAKVWGPQCTFYSVLVNELAAMFAANDATRLTVGKLALLLWQGVRHEDATVTLEQIEEALPVGDLPALTGYAALVLAAWNAQTPDVQHVQEATDTNPLDGLHGPRSGVLVGSHSE